jgi:hypothetical protein
MSRVQITKIDVGDKVRAAQANDTLTEWNTQSTTINDKNVREEGLDRRSIQARAVTPTAGRPTSYISNGNTSPFARTGFDVFVDGAGRVALIGPIDYSRPGGDQQLVRASAHFFVGGLISPSIQFRLAFSTDFNPSTGLGTWTGIDRTKRRYKIGFLFGFTPIGRCTISHLFVAGGSALVTNNLWFRLEIDTGGATSDISDVWLFSTQHAR